MTTGTLRATKRKNVRRYSYNKIGCDSRFNQLIVVLTDERHRTSDSYNLIPDYSIVIVHKFHKFENKKPKQKFKNGQKSKITFDNLRTNHNTERHRDIERTSAHYAHCN